MDERQRQIKAASHTSGVGADPPVGGCREPHPLEKLGASAPGLLCAKTVHHRLQAQELRAAHQGVDRRILERNPDPSPDLGLLGCDVVPSHGRCATGRCQQGHQHANRRGLPGSVGAKKPEDLPSTDIEVDTGDSGQVAETPNKTTRDNGR